MVEMVGILTWLLFEVSSLSPKHRDGMNAFEFRLDLYEIEFATVVQMSSQTEEDYVKVVWKNEANGRLSLSYRLEVVLLTLNT